jgi:hypothetical protein
MVCLISGGWDDSWWLWVALSGAAVVGDVCRIARWEK